LNLETAMIGMANSDCQSIRCIGLQYFFQSQQGLDHMLHLAFVSTTGTYDCQLHLPRRIFMYRQLALEGRTKCRPPRLTQFQGAVCILTQKYALNRYLIGDLFTQNATHADKNLTQTLGEILSRGSNTAAIHVKQSLWAGLYHPIAGNPGPWINTQDTNSR